MEDIMKIKYVINTIIIIFILFIFYAFSGFNFVSFYFGGKAELLETAEHINRLCNANGSCPLTMEGWQGDKDGPLSKHSMLYFAVSGEKSKDVNQSIKPRSFRLVYTMNIPDHWFEAQGGVDKQVTSGWTSR